MAKAISSTAAKLLRSAVTIQKLSLYTKSAEYSQSIMTDCPVSLFCMFYISLKV